MLLVASSCSYNWPSAKSHCLDARSVCLCLRFLLRRPKITKKGRSRSHAKGEEKRDQIQNAKGKSLCGRKIHDAVRTKHIGLGQGLSAYESGKSALPTHGLAGAGRCLLQGVGDKPLDGSSGNRGLRWFVAEQHSRPSQIVPWFRDCRVWSAPTHPTPPASHHASTPKHGRQPITT